MAAPGAQFVVRVQSSWAYVGRRERLHDGTARSCPLRWCNWRWVTRSPAWAGSAILQVTAGCGVIRTRYKRFRSGSRGRPSCEPVVQVAEGAALRRWWRSRSLRSCGRGKRKNRHRCRHRRGVARTTASPRSSSAANIASGSIVMLTGTRFVACWMPWCAPMIDDPASPCDAP
jgi:hypothetical protein